MGERPINVGRKAVGCLIGKSEVLLRIGLTEGAMESIQQGMVLAAGFEEPRLVSDCLSQLNNIYNTMSKYRDMARTARLNLSISQAAGYDGGVASSHNYVGIAYDNSGQNHQAIEHYAMAGEIHRRLGHTEQYISSLENMGVAYYTLGDLDRAEEHYREALRISEANGLLRSDGLLMMCLASVASQRGDYPAAMGMLKRSLAINEMIGETSNRAYTLHEIGFVHYVLGDSERALGFLGESQRIKEEIGDQWGQVTSLNQIARILTDYGKLDEAAAWLEKGERIAAPVDNPDLFCRLAVARGRLALEQENIDAAVAAKDRAIEQSNKAMLKAGRAEAILLWARIDDARGFRRSAEGRYQKALGFYLETGDRLGQGTVQYFQGLGRTAAGEPDKAVEPLVSASAIFQSLGAREWQRRAEAAQESIGPGNVKSISGAAS